MKLEDQSPYSCVLRNMRFLSLFSPTPLQITLPDGSQQLVGLGWGFVSSTFWTRATNCLLSCRGSCCTHWPRPGIGPIWLPGEVIPDGLDQHRVLVNDKPLIFMTQRNLDTQRTCDFWDSKTGLCKIYGSSKPVHCDIDPQIGIYPHRGRYGLFRRLPPRNWRFPKCPVDLALTKPTDASRREADRIFTVYCELASGLGFDNIAVAILAVQSRLSRPGLLPAAGSLEIEKVVNDLLH